MKPLTLLSIFLSTALFWGAILSLILLLSGCATRFPIGNGMSAEVIKIEPRKGPKSVYKIERYA